jgi:hypothetical protein
MNRFSHLIVLITILASVTGIATYVIIEFFVYGSIH